MSCPQTPTEYGTAIIQTATIKGLCVLPVLVEVSVAPGLPGMDVVGMGDTAVHEARARVRSALKAAGFKLPRARITINLAPADLKKEGSAFDLSIALGVLIASAQIKPIDELCSISTTDTKQTAIKTLVIGELSLTGEVKEVSGMLGFEQFAAQEGYGLICAPPRDNIHHRLPCYYLAHLKQLDPINVGDLPYKPFDYAYPAQRTDSSSHISKKLQSLNYADIVGQDQAKRACVISTVGEHSMLMVGPPGSGKTMLAQRMVTLLDPLTHEEYLQCNFIQSVAGISKPREQVANRPFRAPHHSATMAGLMGGGRPIKPGEVTLAHLGILFLDELAEFSNHVLQALREPLETHEVHIVRADGALTFPANFRLVAASNPCPCGYLGDQAHPCSCAPHRIEAYQAKLGGPLADRIELHIHLQRPLASDVIDIRQSLSSEAMYDQVTQGKTFRSWREATRELEKSDTRRTRDLVMQRFGENKTARALLKQAAQNLQLSARSILNTAHVSRTIADLHEHMDVLEEDVVEALAFRKA